MEFRKLLGTLARSSAQAVSTLGHAPEAVDQLKQYLYIETEIERDFRTVLDTSTHPSTIIFLCGSSGDGKSEILKRYYRDYESSFVFHLDATHSFRPDQNAIEALDQVLDKYKEDCKPLVVGINVGMLFNYASSGAKRHSEIKDAINKFIENGESNDLNIFLNFESYPKFSIETSGAGSAFISELLERVAKPVDENPLYVAYLKACENNPTPVCVNYRLLEEQTVRECIVDLLLNARLMFDQFLSARTLLDFVHHLICGPGLLFDNLFVKGHSEFVDTLSHFDPCAIRSQRIDQFLIRCSLGVEDAQFIDFKEAVSQEYGIGQLTPGGWLRAFYVLQGRSIGNGYHKQFKADYHRELYSRYVEVWRLHSRFAGDSDDRQQLRKFYQDQLVAALLRFGNRLSPGLTKRKQVYLSERNGVVISAQADVRPDFKRIQTSPVTSIHHFHVCLKVEGFPLRPFPVNVSFLELVMKINDGYRPNKHDKNTIVILDEILEDITKVAKRAKTLFFTAGNTHAALTNEVDEGEFVVGGAE